MKIFLSLVLTVTSLTLTAHAAAPIDCAKAASPTEKTVCSTPVLLQADARMTAYFEIATQFVGMGVRGDLYDSQQAFPALRASAVRIRRAFLRRIRSRLRRLRL